MTTFSGATKPTSIDQDAYEGSVKAVRSTEIPCVLIQRVEYDTDGNPIYIGYAEPGTAESDTAWILFKYTYVSGNMTEKNSYGVLNGEAASWTLRATYIFH